MSLAVRMKGISKSFGPVAANRQVDLEVLQGEIHAILGENGAGKTTLMNILYGMYQPDAGEIYLYGQKVRLKSPGDGIKLGVGMVHQHFLLVPLLTVTENIVLGLKSPREPFLDLHTAGKKIRRLSEDFGLAVDPEAKVWQLSVGAQQRVEIIKALYRGVNILILDEPTAVLTPQETQDLFKTLRSMAAQGKTVIFITHKLDEVMEISDRVTVLRDERRVATVETRDVDKAGLARMMVGREVLMNLHKRPVPRGDVVLEARDLHAVDDRGLPVLRGVSFSVHGGEILGIAGVDGNGQSELTEVLVGLRKSSAGQVLVNGKDVTDCPCRERIEQGVAHIPEDRVGTGLVMDCSVAENLILETYCDPPFATGLVLRQRAIEENARGLVQEYSIKTANEHSQVKLLSGGNLQKVVLARELSRDPLVLVAAQCTRGLDVGATEYVRSKLLEQRERGKGILLVSADLDEVLSLSDRIAVMYRGEIMGIVPAEGADIGAIGLAMAGSKRLSYEP